MPGWDAVHSNEPARMQAEIEMLREDNDFLRKTCKRVYADNDAQAAEIERLQAKLAADLTATRTETTLVMAWNERLKAALAALIADIEEYERVNKLAPNPGKTDCWQSLTRAKALLGDVPREEWDAAKREPSHPDLDMRRDAQGRLIGFTPDPQTPVMQTAADAAARVEGWSDAKRDAAERIVNSGET